MVTLHEHEPPVPGLYVLYIDGPVERFAERKIMQWYDGKWCYPHSDQTFRGHWYGWVGPLPAMELTVDTAQGDW